MIWQYIALGCALVGGAGLKWGIDRIWPPKVHQPPQHAAPPPVPEARKVLEFEDTMDVLGSGFVAGQQSRNPYALPPAGQPSRLSGRVYEDDGGWISGPCTPSLAPQLDGQDSTPEMLP